MAREDEPLAAGPSKEVDVFTSVRCLGYLSSLTLLVAVCVGMYVRWEVTDEQMILVIFILGLFVLGIASILHYYFAMEKASLSLFHLWFGFLLGLLCFLNSPALDLNIKELVANHLLLGSVVMKALWALTERICRAVHYKPTLLTSAELLELLGFGVASTAMLFHNSVAIIGLVAALGALIVDLRMKSLLALLNLAAFALATSLVFFQALNIAANPYALGCYLGRLLCEPVLDVYFSGLGSSERWLPVLSMGKVWRKLSLLPLSLMELAFFVLAAFKVPSTTGLQRVCVEPAPLPHDNTDVLSSTAGTAGAVVPGDSGLLPVRPFLVHLPRDPAHHHVGLPHQAERVPAGVAGPALRQPQPQPGHGLQGHPPLLPHLRTPGALQHAVHGHPGSRVLAGKGAGRRTWRAPGLVSAFLQASSPTLISALTPARVA